MSREAEPNPEFVERLEWQIRSELRRKERFEHRSRPFWKRRNWQTAALVGISVLLGYAGAIAAQELSERHRRQLLELQTRSRLEMAELELDFATERVAQIERLTESEDLPADQRRQAFMDRESMEREVVAARLDLQELRATGRTPRHDLAAPLVEGSDLVSRRLRLRRDSLQERLTVVAWRIEFLWNEVHAGEVPEIEVLRLEAEQDRVIRELDLVDRLLDLRDDFLSGNLREEEVLFQRDLHEAHVQSVHTRDELELARTRLDFIEELAEAGSIDRLAAEHAVRMAEIRAETASARLAILEEAANGDLGEIVRSGEE